MCFPKNKYAISRTILGIDAGTSVCQQITHYTAVTNLPQVRESGRVREGKAYAVQALKREMTG